MSSQKINAKNLSYSQKLPPFLAALRDQIGGQTGPDPILAAHRRPVKHRSASEEAEDAPLVLDEHGDVVTGVTVGVDGAAEMVVPAEERPEDKKEERSRQDEIGVAGIGASKKRKVGKLIGADEDGRHGREKEGDKRNHAIDKLPEKKGAGSAKDASDNKRAAKEKKKGSKKIKMSFEDDGDV